MRDLRLSVVMPMYNAARYVEDAIDSVLAQTMPDFIFYIVDDGSTDGSGEIATQMAAQDSRIHLIRQDNHGIVASLNRMLELVDTPFVARMDADDISLPDRFARQLERIEIDADLGALGTQFVEIDNGGRARNLQFRQPVGRAEVRAQLEIRQPVANPTVMFRTQILRDVGLYRQAFRYCEDYDLFLRLSEIADIDNLSEILLHYRRSPGQMSVLNNGHQTRQAAYARLAHTERGQDRRDPFDGMDDLPALDELDAILGRRGVARAVQTDVLADLRYAVASMNEAEYADFIRTVRRGVPLTEGWRTVIRCLINQRIKRAAQLALALVQGHWAKNSRVPS